MAKIINNTKIFGIMGGLAPMRNISASTHVAYRVGDARIHQDIPLDPKRGLAYMLGQNPMGKYMLSRNPQCAGGIGRMALVSGRGAYTTPTREKVVFIPTGFPKNLGAFLGGAERTPYIIDHSGMKWSISEWSENAPVGLKAPHELIDDGTLQANGFKVTSGQTTFYVVLWVALAPARTWARVLTEDDVDGADTPCTGSLGCPGKYAASPPPPLNNWITAGEPLNRLSLGRAGDSFVWFSGDTTLTNSFTLHAY